MAKGIIVFGGMGTGKTTLAKALAKQLDFYHMDTDDYLFDRKAKVPLTVYNPKEERIERMLSDIAKHPRFVLSGQMWSIRKVFAPLFDIGVFITAPTEVCVERFCLREVARFGNRILPGGDMYALHQEALSLVKQYDTGKPPAVCLKRDEQWAEELPCPILHVDGTRPIAENALWLAGQYAAYVSACII